MLNYLFRRHAKVPFSGILLVRRVRKNEFDSEIESILYSSLFDWRDSLISENGINGLNDLIWSYANSPARCTPNCLPMARAGMRTIAKRSWGTSWRNRCRPFTSETDRGGTVGAMRSVAVRMFFQDRWDMLRGARPDLRVWILRQGEGIPHDRSDDASTVLWPSRSVPLWRRLEGKTSARFYWTLRVECPSNCRYALWPTPDLSTLLAACIASTVWGTSSGGGGLSTTTSP